MIAFGDAPRNDIKRVGQIGSPGRKIGDFAQRCLVELAADSLAECVMPERFDTEMSPAGFSARAQFPKQVEQPDHVVVVDVAEHGQFELAPIRHEALHGRFQVSLIGSGGAAIDQDKTRRSRVAIFQEQAIPKGGLHDVQLEHEFDSSARRAPGACRRVEKIPKAQNREIVKASFLMMFAMDRFRRYVVRSTNVVEAEREVFYRAMQKLTRRSLPVMSGMGKILDKKPGTLSQPLLIVAGEHDLPVILSNAQAWQKLEPNAHGPYPRRRSLRQHGKSGIIQRRFEGVPLTRGGQ